MSYADQSTAGERVEAEIASLRAQLEKAEKRRDAYRDLLKSNERVGKENHFLKRERDELRAQLKLADHWIRCSDLRMKENQAKEAYRAAREGGGGEASF